MKAWCATRLSVAFCLALGACAGSLPEASEPARGSIDLNARVPTLPTRPSPYGSAYGGETGLRASVGDVDLAPYLKLPEPNPKKKKTDMPASQAKAREREPERAVAVASRPQPAPQPSAAAEAEPEPLVASLDARAPAAPSPRGEEAERYAAREQRTPALQQFRGGEAVVITSGALVVILLIVILILLLT